MKTGLQLMFARRFWRNWGIIGGILGSGIIIGHYVQREWDKEAYAMRGRSNMFRQDYERLKASGSKRELWT